MKKGSVDPELIGSRCLFHYALISERNELMSFFEYLRKDLKLSAKTVFSQFPRYLSFTAVLLLLSVLFLTVCNLNFNHQRTQYAYLESRYISNSGEVYHIRISDLTEGQYYTLLQFQVDQGSDNKIFKFVGGIESTVSGTQEKRYDVDIQFSGDIDQSYETFIGRYTEALDAEGTDYTITKTPLLDMALKDTVNTIIFLLLIALIVAAGVAALWVLHSTMINHYKFTYGIYMTFGATFGRLFLTAFWEQFWIVLITWLPSSLMGVLISWLVFRQTGFAFSIYWWGFLWAFLLNMLTVAIAVFISIRAASAKTPTSLIAAADNSNFISSPRVSYDLIGSAFPSSIGKITYRRYRKYIVRLMAGTLSFSMLFVAVSTIGYCYERVLTLDQPEISVDFNIPEFVGEDGKTYTDYSAYGYDSEKSELFHSLEGIKTIKKRAYYQAYSLCSHVKIDRKIPKLFAGGVNIGGLSGDDKGFLNVDYNAIDEELIETFHTLGYEVEGSLESVLTDRKTVAVTEGFLGSARFDWEVGDTILIADLPDQDTCDRLNAIAGSLMTAELDKILGAWLRDAAFSYTEYTVGAIISEIPTDQNWGIYFSAKDYKAVTGFEPTYNELEIYADEDATESQISYLYYELRDAADYYTNMTVIDLDTATLKTMEENKNYASIITLISIVLLTVSPLIWFFYQMLFYQKRHPEFTLLQSMGASSSSIKRYLMGDAIRFALTGGLLFAILAPLVSWLMHRVVGYVMLFAGDTMLASFHLPITAYSVGILLNLICGFASVYLAWIIYLRNRPSIYNEPKSKDRTNQVNDKKEASV